MDNMSLNYKSKQQIFFLTKADIVKMMTPDFVIVSPKNLRQRVWRFSDALPSALFGYKPPCSKVA